DAGDGAGGDRRRQGGGEDEAGSEGAHEVAQGGGGGDVAAHDAEGLAKGALDDGETVHQPFAFGDAAAARPVQADGMDLVEIGHGAVALGDVDDLGDRRDVAVHRVDRLEGHELGTAR